MDMAKVNRTIDEAIDEVLKDYKKAFITSDRIQLPYNVFCDPSLDDELEMDEVLDTINNETIITNDSIIDVR